MSTSPLLHVTIEALKKPQAAARHPGLVPGPGARHLLRAGRRIGPFPDDSPARAVRLRVDAIALACYVNSIRVQSSAQPP